MEQVTLGLPSHPCTISPENYLGWNTIRLSNGIVDVLVAPEIGGRILQLRLGGQEYLYVNHRHAGRVYTSQENNHAAGWKNYGGSKVWPAPQGWLSDSEWPGPPDPVLDGGKYSWEIIEQEAGEAALALTSPPDEYTGLTLYREIRLFTGAATISIHHSMRNSSSRPVRWAIWQVTQQRAGPSFAAFAPAKEYRQVLGDDKFGAAQSNHNSGLFKLPYADRVAKFAVKAEEGWICSLDSSRGIALAESFQLFPNANYVDNAPVAFWVNGAGSYSIHLDRLYTQNDPNGCDAYVETEVFSPIVDLAPGEEYSFDILWHCTKLREDSIERVNHCAAVARDLRAERENDGLHVSGSFGVFETGAVELLSLCKDGRVAAVESLGPVSPLLPCSVEARVPVVENLFRLSLRMRNRCGELLGTIADILVSPPADVRKT